MDVKKFSVSLCSLMSVSGFEYTEEDRLRELVMPYFDETESDSVGNHIFVLRCGKPSPKKLFIDAHYDEVGLIVKGICDDGMLRVCSIGGVDARLFPAADVVVYGKKRIPGVIAVKPGNLYKSGEKGKLVPVKELLVDTGYTKDEISALVGIGTPIGYAPVYSEMGGGKYICGKGLDDKICASSVVYAVSMLKRENLGCDIYFSMSSKEEVGHRAVSSAAFRIKPDYAIALDVTFGMAPGGDKETDMEMGGGAVITHSLITNKEFSDFIRSTAKENGLPFQSDVCPVRTGTHADDIAFVSGGIPTALVSIPIWFMHTAIETVCTDDIENTAKLLCRVIETKFREA